MTKGVIERKVCCKQKAKQEKVTQEGLSHIFREVKEISFALLILGCEKPDRLCFNLGTREERNVQKLKDLEEVIRIAIYQAGKRIESCRNCNGWVENEGTDPALGMFLGYCEVHDIDDIYEYSCCSSWRSRTSIC